MPGVPGGRETGLKSAYCCLIHAACIGLYGRGRLNADGNWLVIKGHEYHFSRSAI